MNAPADWFERHRVTVHKVIMADGAEMFFREPSATDYMLLQQLLVGLQRAGAKTLDESMVVPLVLCKDESGALLFPDYTEGVQAIQRLEAKAQVEIMEACLRVTGLGDLLKRGVENAEKKS
jgi:hypothetical protein